MQSDKKKRTKKEVKKKTLPIISMDKNEEEKASGFDFGGLPSRDLKKNLGCG